MADFPVFWKHRGATVDPVFGDPFAPSVIAFKRGDDPLTIDVPAPPPDVPAPRRRVTKAKRERSVEPPPDPSAQAAAMEWACADWETYELDQVLWWGRVVGPVINAAIRGDDRPAIFDLPRSHSEEARRMDKRRRAWSDERRAKDRERRKLQRAAARRAAGKPQRAPKGSVLKRPAKKLYKKPVMAKYRRSAKGPG